MKGGCGDMSREQERGEYGDHGGVEARLALLVRIIVLSSGPPIDSSTTRNLFDGKISVGFRRRNDR